MESAYNTPKAASEEMVGSLLGMTNINYVGHRECVHGASARERQEREYPDTADLARRKEMAGVQERQRLHREIRNRAWSSAIPHHLNVMELSWEELQDIICLRYELMPQDIPRPVIFAVRSS